MLASDGNFVPQLVRKLSLAVSLFIHSVGEDLA